jgi:predicted peptidase
LSSAPSSGGGRKGARFAGIVLACAVPAGLTAAGSGDSFIARTFRGSNGLVMPYRLFVPRSAVRSRPLPLIVYLHGGAGAGLDNLRQISGGNRRGTHLWIQQGLQEQHPAFVVAPQAPPGEEWGLPESDSLAPYASLVIELIRGLAQEFAVDPTRLYVIGQSLGGEGVWDLIAKRPTLFAAAVPVCGRGSRGKVIAARHVAIWAFHGAKDEVVPVSRSRELVAPLRAVGGVVRYSEYPDIDHLVWETAFAEPELPAWLFSQTRPPGGQPR